MGPETTTELNTWKPGALGLSCSSVRSEPHGALTAAVQHLLSPPCPSAPSVPGTWPQHFAGLGHQVILAKACGTRPLPAGASPHCQHTRATLTPGRADPTGARWDTQTGVIAEARLKDLTPAMPVIFIKAIPRASPAGSAARKWQMTLCLSANRAAPAPGGAAAAGLGSPSRWQSGPPGPGELTCTQN